MVQLKSRYDYLYLSPHFDDVALSCGGQVFLRSAAAESVLVVTMTGAEPPDDLRSDTVASLHRRWAGSLGGQMTGSIVAARRAEDREALAALGADAHPLPFLDCIYRRSPKSGNLLYPGPDDMFGELNPEDSEIFGSLAAAFAALPAAGQVLLPLTVGGHVDHRILRIVRHREALHFEVPETKGGTRLEKLPVDPVLQAALDGFGRAAVGKDADIGMPGESAERGGMVAVLVGEEDRIDALPRLRGGGQQLAQFPRRKAGVDEHAGVVGLQQGGIAGAAAAKDAKTQGHARD